MAVRIRLDLLLRDIASGFTIPPNGRIVISAEDVWLGVERAILLGLAARELVANALRHAWPDQRAGTLSLGLFRKGWGRIVLSVRDDGVGTAWPPGHAGLGTAIVNACAREAGCRLTYSAGVGSDFRLEFGLMSSRLSLTGRRRRWRRTNS